MAPKPDFLARLEEELASCQLQTVDPETATIEAIVKDVHKMLTGNGGPTRGLIVKVAAANVSIKDIQDRVDTITGDAELQKQTCADFRAKHAIAAAKAEGATAKKIVSTLWDNRAVLLVLLIAGVVYITTGWREDTRDGKLDIKLESVLDQKLEQLLDIRVKALTGIKDGRNNDNRTGARK